MSSSRIVTRYALSHWYIYLFGAAMLGTHTVLNTYIPKQTGVIIDMFTEKAPRADILALIWPLVAVVFFSFACLIFLSRFALCISNKFNRNALETTQKLLKLIAAAPNMGLSSQPNIGIHTPAASGMPITL